MLFHTFHAASAYEQSVLGVSPLYDSLLHILDDVRDNCTLVCHQSDIDRILGAIGTWPAKYRQAAQTRIGELRRRQRILLSSDGQLQTGNCSLGNITACHEVSGHRMDLSLVGEACGACSTILGFVKVSDYPLTAFANTRRIRQSFKLGYDQWSKRAFETNVWEPVFRYATNVKAVDRNIGYLIHNTVARQNYQRGFAWILKQWSQSTSANRGTFEIYTAFRPSQMGEGYSQRELEDAVRAWAEPLQNISGQLIVKTVVEHGNNRLPHDRYLLTRQITIQIGPGFDLLDACNRVREVTLSNVVHDGGYDAQLTQNDNPFKIIVSSHEAL